MSDCDDTVEESSTSRPTMSRRTYGKARRSSVDGPDALPSMTFAFSTTSHQQIATADSLLHQFSENNSNWRQSLANIDATVGSKETEIELQEARERFRSERLASASDQRDRSWGVGRLLQDEAPNVSTIEARDASSVSSPTDFCASTPNRAPNHRAADEPHSSSSPSALDGGAALSHGGELDAHGVDCAFEFTALKHAPSPRLPLAISQDVDGDDSESRANLQSFSRPKGVRRIDAELAHRDAARALRERPAGLSRPDNARRPVSQWLSNAQSVASLVTAPSPHPGTSPEDIRQFTPSSAPHDDASIASHCGLRAANQRQSSSPTPHHGTSRPSAEEGHDEYNDDGDNFTLDAALSRKMEQQQKQKRLAAIKAEAAKTQALRLASVTDEDDFTVLPDAVDRHHPAPGVVHRRASDGRRQSHPESSTLSSKVPFIEHAARLGIRSGQSSSRHFNQHTGLVMANGRPASKSQLDAHLSAQHLLQVRQITQRKERLFGPGRDLPMKSRLDATLVIPTTAASAPESDESDSDYAPPSGDEAVEQPIGLDSAIASVSEGGDEDALLLEHDDKENHPILPRRWVSPDVEDNVLAVKAPLRRARVVIESDDEDGDDALKPPAQTVLKQPDATRTAEALEVTEFGVGDSGFSQLFAETQDGEMEMGLAGIRDNAPQGLAPSDVLLPSVVISESQKRRDNALIAAELANAEAEDNSVEPTVNYLNSQGYFTQTRPAELDSQAVSKISSTHHTMGSGFGKTSSTLIGSAQRPLSSASSGEGGSRPNNLSPTQESERQQSTRLRPHHQGSTIEDSPMTNTQPIRIRDAFEVLGKHAARQASATRKGNVLVDEQAEESDDEGGWGLITTGNGEDDDEDDQQGYVPDLLDDSVVDDSVIQDQNVLVAEKHRQVEQADDAQREAEAKKVTEGYFRHKRRGKDFLSDEEDDDGRPRRLNKKQRRQRKLDREDGLFKLGGEENVFLEAYEEDLHSDNEFEENTSTPAGIASPGGNLTAHERRALLRKRAQMNRDSTTELLATEVEGTQEAEFSIGRAIPRTIASAEVPKQVTAGASTSRSLSSFSKFVSEESLNPRRNGGGAVSVVVQRPTSLISASRDSRTGNKPSRQLSRQATGSILLERGKRFGM